jgi:CRISPR-associated protein Cmr2
MVLKDSHRLLDDVAKEKTGRDAVAVRVWKPGGETLTWAMKWGENGANVNVLNTLATEFKDEEDGKPGHASKPLFRIRERLEMLKGAVGFDETPVQKLLIAEYVSTGVLRNVEEKYEIAENRINQLLPLCKKPDGGYGAEAAMLLRFLAQKGMER